MIGGCRWVDGSLISLDNWRCLWHLSILNNNTIIIKVSTIWLMSFILN